MPEWSGPPKASKPARLSARLIATSWAKLPPAPPYSSGIDAHNSPAAPALVQTSRSYMPASFQRSRCGTNSASMKRRACSSSSTTSSVIQAGRGTSRGDMSGPRRWRESSALEKSRSASKCLRRQFHHRRGAGLNAGEPGRGFRQHALHEEARGDELRFHPSGGVGAADLRGRGDPAPHVPERHEAEEMHVVGRPGTGIVRLADGVLHEPHGCLLEVAERLAERFRQRLHGGIGRLFLDAALHLAEERHDRASAIPAELAADEVECLDAVG